MNRQSVFANHALSPPVSNLVGMKFASVNSGCVSYGPCRACKEWLSNETIVDNRRRAYCGGRGWARSAIRRAGHSRQTAAGWDLGPLPCPRLFAGEVGFQLRHLLQFEIEFVLQRERLAQPRLVAGEACDRPLAPARLHLQVRLEVVERVLQPGDQPQRREVVRDVDHLVVLRPPQHEAHGLVAAEQEASRPSHTRSNPPIRPMVHVRSLRLQPFQPELGQQRHRRPPCAR